MQPTLSYTIWFTQRTGSTLLCKALEGTRIAGNPGEWLHKWLDEQKADRPAELQQRLWEAGSTINAVFGQKHSFSEPHFTEVIDTFRRFPGVPVNETNRVKIWEAALPNHKHIFLTRRNRSAWQFPGGRRSKHSNGIDSIQKHLQPQISAMPIPSTPFSTSIVNVPCAKRESRSSFPKAISHR